MLILTMSKFNANVSPKVLRVSENRQEREIQSSEMNPKLKFRYFINKPKVL